MSRSTTFEEWEARQMQDPEFREAAEELEPAYQVALLRMRRGLTQKELAKRVGTRQSSIARLEGGKTQPSLSFLRRVVKALGARLEVRILPEETQAAVVAQRGTAAAGIVDRMRELGAQEEALGIFQKALRSPSDTSDAASADQAILIVNWPLGPMVSWTDSTETCAVMETEDD